MITFYTLVVLAGLVMFFSDWSVYLEEFPED